MRCSSVPRATRGQAEFELYIPKGKAAQVWDAILEAGQPYGIEPAGLAARDTLRLEMGVLSLRQ